MQSTLSVKQTHTFLLVRSRSVCYLCSQARKNTPPWYLGNLSTAATFTSRKLEVSLVEMANAKAYVVVWDLGQFPRQESLQVMRVLLRMYVQKAFELWTFDCWLGCRKTQLGNLLKQLIKLKWSNSLKIMMATIWVLQATARCILYMHMHQSTYPLIWQYKHPTVLIVPLVHTHSWQTPPHRTSSQVWDGGGLL